MAATAVALSGFAWLGDSRAPWWTPVVEGVAVLAWLGGAGVVAGTGDAPAVSIALTLGAVAAAAHVLRPRRRFVAAWTAAVLGLCVVWVRLWIADVVAIDAYTLPASALLLLAGSLLMRRHPALGSWPALGPGLLVAAVPPLVVALLGDDVVRPLVVLAVAVAATVLGAVRRLSAPLTIGALTAAVVAVDQVFPVVLAMPRWLTLGTIGALLIYLGATFERRRTQARTAVRRYRDLR